MLAKMNGDELLASLQRCVSSLSVAVIVQDMVYTKHCTEIIW